MTAFPPNTPQEFKIRLADAQSVIDQAQAALEQGKNLKKQVYEDINRYFEQEERVENKEQEKRVEGKNGNKIN